MSKKTKAMYRELFEQIKCIAEHKSIELEVKFNIVVILKAFVDAFPDAATDCFFFSFSTIQTECFPFLLKM